MKTVSAIIIGAGSRGRGYANYIKDHPDEFKVLAVAEPLDNPRNHIKNTHGLSDEMCFTDWKDILEKPKMADVALICTQDKMHFEPAMKAIEKGYDILLEKPVSPDPEECRMIASAANKKGIKVVVCHVLRYAVFFEKIKEVLDSGAIGDIVSITHSENVGDYHQAHSFVRGNWRNSEESSPMILAKCCHDMDILRWLVGRKCKRVSSFGSLKYFCEKNAPENAPAYCTDGCPAAESCPYEAKRVYVENGSEWFRSVAAKKPNPTDDEVLEAIKTGPYGRCVFRCDNDVVDHQVVSMEFEDDITVAFSMCAFTPTTDRTLKIMGTKGQIRGKLGSTMSIELTDFLTKTTTDLAQDLHLDGHVGHGGGGPAHDACLI